MTEAHTKLLWTHLSDAQRAYAAGNHDEAWRHLGQCEALEGTVAYSELFNRLVNATQTADVGTGDVTPDSDIPY